MKRTWSKPGILFLIMLLTMSAGIEPIQDKNAPVFRYGALAIDRNNGYYYAFSVNSATLSEAVKNAIAECNKKGGKCTLVLSYAGSGCVAYRTSAGKNVGLAYGWGIAKNREDADKTAMKECNDRTYGMEVPNLVFSCNDQGSGNLNVIYNASREIDFLMGVQADY